jgi:hypothetical protein
LGWALRPGGGRMHQEISRLTRVAAAGCVGDRCSCPVLRRVAWRRRRSRAASDDVSAGVRVPRVIDLDCARCAKAAISGQRATDPPRYALDSQSSLARREKSTSVLESCLMATWITQCGWGPLLVLSMKAPRQAGRHGGNFSVDLEPSSLLRYLLDSQSSLERLLVPA